MPDSNVQNLHIAMNEESSVVADHETESRVREVQACRVWSLSRVGWGSMVGFLVFSGSSRGRADWRGRPAAGAGWLEPTAGFPNPGAGSIRGSCSCTHRG